MTSASVPPPGGRRCDCGARIVNRLRPVSVAQTRISRSSARVGRVRVYVSVLLLVKIWPGGLAQRSLTSEKEDQDLVLTVSHSRILGENSLPSSDAIHIEAAVSGGWSATRT